MKQTMAIFVTAVLLAATAASSTAFSAGQAASPARGGEAANHLAGPAASPTPAPAGFYIAGITLARGVQGQDNTPVDPTGVFQATDTFHAVVQIQNAPANTTYKSSWVAVDVGNAAPPNTAIDSTQVTTNGSRNIDFSLTPPQTNWPVGIYSVEIDVNDVKAANLLFSVQ